jgi:hypothetical protein
MSRYCVRGSFELKRFLQREICNLSSNAVAIAASFLGREQMLEVLSSVDHQASAYESLSDENDSVPVLGSDDVTHVR